MILSIKDLNLFVFIVVDMRSTIRFLFIEREAIVSTGEHLKFRLEFFFLHIGPMFLF
jgi:hypothetical protein